eukprot:3598092-Prymnesium_polylepis.1
MAIVVASAAPALLLFSLSGLCGLVTLILLVWAARKCAALVRMCCAYLRPLGLGGYKGLARSEELTLHGKYGEIRIVSTVSG